MKQQRLVCISVILFVATMFVRVAVAQHSYTEDFTTTTYQDVLTTTALWDTATGELKLFPYVPTLAGSYDTPGNARDVAISGDHAFVADRSSGLQVIDISDPATPMVVGSYDTPGHLADVAVSGDRAYLADGPGGLIVLDITIPETPVLISQTTINGNAKELVVAGDVVYVAAEGAGLVTLDINDPSNPIVIGNYDSSGSALDVCVDGDFCFLADKGTGLQILDISDPSTPGLIGSYDTPGNAYAVSVAGNTAFVADEGAGLQVIDVSDPSMPFHIAALPLPGNAVDVSVAGDLVYVAGSLSGIHVVDVTDTTAPQLVGSLESADQAWGVTVEGSVVYVSSGLAGLASVQVSQSDFNTSLNVAQSLVISDSGNEILSVSLNSTQVDSMSWEISADGGTNWQDITADGIWADVDVSGTKLVWRSTHSLSQPGLNPAVSNLMIDWAELITKRYVAEAGDDSLGDGSFDLPFETIQHAINVSADGDTVILFDGAFTGPGNVNVSWQDKSLAIKSDSNNRDACVIECAGEAGFVFENTPPYEQRNLSFTGLTVSGASTAISVTGNSLDRPKISVLLATTNCSFRDGEAGIDVRDCRTEMEGTSVFGNAEVGVSGNCPFELATNNCVVRGNGTGIQFYYYSYYNHAAEMDSTEIVANGIGVSYGGQMPVTMTNCRVDSNYVGYGIAAGTDGDYLTLENCSVRDNAGRGVYLGDETWLFANNCDISGNGSHGIDTVYPTSIILENVRLIGNQGWGIGCNTNSAAQQANNDEKYRLGDIHNCYVLGNDLGGVKLIEFIDEISIENTVIADNAGPGLYMKARYDDYTTWSLDNVTITGNSGDGIIASTNDWSATGTLIAFNGGVGIELLDGSTVDLTCCDIFGNTGGDWTDPILPQFGGGNISLDPQFCGADNADDPYALKYTSPCSADNSDCGQIGALGVGFIDIPIISSITDVGNDQGKQVRLIWQQSEYDNPATAHTITGYGIYREQGSAKDASRVTTVRDKLFGWDYIATVPARQDSIYQYIAPTLCDSTITSGLCFSTFMISAMTSDPGTYFDSRPDSGYSVDNLSPAEPENVMVTYASTLNSLSWDSSSDSDLSHYSVYRTSISEVFLTETADSLGTTFGTAWPDTIGQDEYAWGFRYWVVAVDLSGNRSAQSGQSDPLSDVPVVPAQTALHAAVPNPFNPQTRISFDLAKPARVDLRVFDIAGRLIKTLINSESRQPSRYQVYWTGQDNYGRSVAAGVYFYKLDAGSFSETKRMTLVK